MNRISLIICSFKTLSKYICLLLLLSGTALAGFALGAENATIARNDSLENLLEESIEDTLRVAILRRLSIDLRKKDPDKSFEYNRLSLALAEGLVTSSNSKIANAATRMLAQNLNSMGLSYRMQGNYAKAIAYFFQSLKINKGMGNEKEVAGNLNNIGTVYYSEGDFDKAIDYFLQALRIKEQLGLKKEVATSLNNIGLVYRKQENYDKAMQYSIMSLEIKMDLNDKPGIAVSLSNIGVIYRIREQYEEAIDYYRQSLNIDRELGNKEGIAYTLNSIGVVYHFQGNSDGAMTHYLQSLAIKEEIGDRLAIANSLVNIGGEYINRGNYKKALNHLNRSLEIAMEIGAKDEIKRAYENLSQAYFSREQFEKAYRHYKLYGQMKDSLFNEDKSKEIGRLEAKYEMEKNLENEKRLADELAGKVHAAELRRNNLQYSGILIFIVLVFTMVFMLGKIAMPIRLAEGIVFFSFLLFFEFTLVLLDPFIERYSSGAPAVILSFNAIIAALVFPLHSFFEQALKKRIFDGKNDNDPL